MFQNIGLPEILVILLVLLVFFGPKYLEELARQLGKAGRELRNINQEYTDVVEEIKKPVEKKTEKLTNKKKKKGGES